MMEEDTEICLFQLDASNKNSRITIPSLMLKLPINSPLEKHVAHIDEYYRSYVSAFLGRDSMRIFGPYSPVDTLVPLYMFLDRSKRLPVFTVKYEQSLSDSQEKKAGWRRSNRIFLIHEGVKREMEKDCDRLIDILHKLKLENVSCVIGSNIIPSSTRLADLEKYKLDNGNIYIRADPL